MTPEELFERGFVREAEFPNEYTLYVNRKTMQRVRIYIDGAVWITNLKTGEYEKGGGK